MANTPSYYEILGVERDADETALKSAWRKKLMAHHPDHNPDDKKSAEERTARIQAAYAVLKDPQERAHYDSLLKRGIDYEEYISRRQSGPFARNPDMSQEAKAARQAAAVRTTAAMFYKDAEGFYKNPRAIDDPLSRPLRVLFTSLSLSGMWAFMRERAQKNHAWLKKHPRWPIVIGAATFFIHPGAPAAHWAMHVGGSIAAAGAAYALPFVVVPLAGMAALGVNIGMHGLFNRLSLTGRDAGYTITGLIGTTTRFAGWTASVAGSIAGAIAAHSIVVSLAADNVDFDKFAARVQSIPQVLLQEGARGNGDAPARRNAPAQKPAL